MRWFADDARLLTPSYSAQVPREHEIQQPRALLLRLSLEGVGLALIAVLVRLAQDDVSPAALRTSFESLRSVFEVLPQSIGSESTADSGVKESPLARSFH
jgi:hypothetical protein